MPQVRQHQRRGRVAGDHHDVRPEGGDEAADHRDDPGDELLLGPSAVGEAGVVGQIQVFGIGPQRRHLGVHGETAEAGIEDEYLGCARHTGEKAIVAKDGRRIIATGGREIDRHRGEFQTRQGEQSVDGVARRLFSALF